MSDRSAAVENPFPGPQPYRAEGRRHFHGREELCYRLLGSVLANRCVVVHGPSGAGKSSLLQAAVLPALVDKEEARVVRVDGWPEGQDPTAWLADAAYAGLGLGERPPDAPAGEALVAAAQRAARRSSRIVLCYLDQVEQLLYGHREEAEVLAFFEGVSALAELPLRNLRVVLSLREDYLGRFRDRLRDHRRLLDHGFRVGPLTVDEITDAVCRAAGAGEPAQAWDAAEMHALMLQVRVPGQAAGGGAEAQAAYAQIVCRALFQERAEARGGGREIEAEAVLRRYLEATLAALGPRRPLAERLLEGALVTAEGSRTLRTEKELARLLPEGELAPVLAALEGAAILHAEEHQGSRYFEIGHDWLARKVFEERGAREEARERAREKAEAEARLATERGRRRRLAGLAAGSMVVAAIAAGLGYEAHREGEVAVAASSRAQEGEHDARAAKILEGCRELATRGELSWATSLLLEVDHPEARRGWVELANEVLDAETPLVTLSGHKGSVQAVAWSPDGKRIVTASDDGTARVWSADGEGSPRVLQGHEGAVSAASWSPDGARIVTASGDGTARVWSADGKGQPVVLRGHEGAVVSASWSPDGARVVTASADGTARIWDSASGALLRTLDVRSDGPVTVAFFHPDGKRVITASHDGAVQVWSADPKGPPVVLKGHTGEVRSAALSPDGRLLVTASRDWKARIWDLDGKRPPVVLAGHELDLSCASFSADGLHVVTAARDGTARVWGVDGRPGPVLYGHERPVRYAAFLPDGLHVVTVADDGTGRLWLVDGKQPLQELQGHQARVHAAALSPDGSRLVTASADGTARVWSAQALGLLPRQHGKRTPYAAAFDRSGERVIAAYGDRVARVFRADGEGGDSAAFSAQGAWITGVGWSPGGDRVVLSSLDSLARVFRVAGATEAVTLAGHTAGVRFAAFDPEGLRVVTASDDRTARIDRLDGSAQPVVLSGHEDWVTSAAWSRDGARVVTTSDDNTARVFQAASGALLFVVQHDGDVNAAAFQPTGHDGEPSEGSPNPSGRALLATASSDRTVRLWDANGHPAAPVAQVTHAAPVLRVAWSDDGKLLASASADGTVLVSRLDDPHETVELTASAPVLAMELTDGGQRLVAMTEDNKTYTWLIGVPALLQRLRGASTDCLPASMRMLHLDESPQVSSERYEACERKHGREPGGAPAPDITLAAAERRVDLIVLPVDAQVDVDDHPAVRRDGTVELTGKVKEVHTVRVFKGSRLREVSVTIGEAGAEPAVVDLDAPPAPAAGGPAMSGSAASASAKPPPPPGQPSGPLYEMGDGGLR